MLIGRRLRNYLIGSLLNSSLFVNAGMVVNFEFDESLGKIDCLEFNFLIDEFDRFRVRKVESLCFSGC